MLLIILFFPYIGVKIGGVNEKLTVRTPIPKQLAGLIGRSVQSEVSPNPSLLNTSGTASFPRIQ